MLGFSPWTEAEPTSPSQSDGVFVALALMTLLDWSTELNLREEGSWMLGAAIKTFLSFFLLFFFLQWLRSTSRAFLKCRNKCLRHSRRHHSHFWCSIVVPEQFRLVADTEPLCVQHRRRAFYAVTSWLPGQPQSPSVAIVAATVFVFSILCGPVWLRSKRRAPFLFSLVTVDGDDLTNSVQA